MSSYRPVENLLTQESPKELSLFILRKKQLRERKDFQKEFEHYTSGTHQTLAKTKACQHLKEFK